jgi:GTP-binding protein
MLHAMCESPRRRLLQGTGRALLYDTMDIFHHRARFLLSAHTLAQLPPDLGTEAAFAGRSNSGKSSAINAIIGVTRLARTSKTPGCTQQLNFFELDDAKRLVDLPGYGYAHVPDHVSRRWQHLLTRYLETRRCLRGLILVMDVRHPLMPYDVQMLAWCRQADLSAHLLLTKCDKLSRGAVQQTLRAVREHLPEHHPAASVQPFSARLRTGVDEARAVLSAWLADAPE